MDFTFTNNIPTGYENTFLAASGALTYDWDFGDGTTGSGQEVKKTFETPGTYTVTLTTDVGSARGTQTVVGCVDNQQTVSMPLTLISDERYAEITMRNLASSWPIKAYDNGAYPVRKVRVWPVPQGTYSVELWLWQPLATYETLDDELNLPPGYERYLRYKLAAELAPEFGKELSDTFYKNLTEAEAAVKRLNQQLPIGERSRQARYLDVPRNVGRA